MTKHSPGPWVNMGMSGSGLTERFDVEHRSESSSYHICTIEVLNNTREARERAEANARLIAAAPDLLAACRQMVASLNGSAFDTMGMLAAHRALDAAIAKAEKEI
jgi:hypothetical protein